MAAPVAAPDEIIKLHNDLLDTPLDDVETLRRMAFRACALAARQPRDYLVVLTTALALARSGQREEAVPFARQAFELRFGASLAREEITAVCCNLGLVEEAAVTAREICGIPAFADDEIAVNNACTAAFLMGDVNLLRRIHKFASGNVAAVPDDLLEVIGRAEIEPYLPGHMQIVNRYVKDSCCMVEIDIDQFNNDEKPFIHIRHRLALELRPCLKLFDEMMLALENYYLDAGREDLAYGDVIVHGFAPMPAFRKAAA